MSATDPTPTADTATVELPDGRVRSYAVHGADEGPWLVHHHGTGSSRLEGALFDVLAREHGLRVLTVDRPSYGSSTPDDARTLAQWPADLAEVLTHLGIERFAVSGISGGGPHALAVAALMPQRVTRALIINTGGPTFDEEVLAQASAMDRKVWTMARDNPEKFRARVSPMMSREPGRAADLLARVLLPKLDRTLASEPSVRDVMERAGAEGRRQPGMRFDEALLIWSDDWGFDPYAVTVPVTVFSGEKDQARAFNTKLARTAPGGELVSFPGGHMAFLADDVMARIVTTATAQESQR